VFGKIQYKNNYFEERTRVYLPESITLIMMKYFSLNRDSFLSDSCEIPQKMFKLGKKHAFACLIAFIIDEGHIDSTLISIGLDNKKHIAQLSEICRLLNYKYTVSARKPKGQDLYILKDGTIKLWQDYLALKKEYPEINMGYKEKSLRNFIDRLGKNWKSKGTNQTKNQIIGVLRSESKPINKISEQLMISRQGIRFQLKQLEKAKIVMKHGKTRQSGDIYRLIQNIALPESKKGASKPIGFTNEKILQILSQTQLSTTQLVKKIGMQRDSLRNQLHRLEKNKKIKRVGTVKTIARPTILWQAV